MPKFDRWMLAGLGIAIIAIFFTARWSPEKKLELSNAQAPIDPKTLSGDFDLNGKIGQFHGSTVSVPETPDLAGKQPGPDDSQVLGINDDQKVIYVDLANQKAYAFEGNNLVYDFVVSTGKWGRTPTGTFTIWGKFRYTKMSGGSRALHTYYYLPNVPYVMFFSNDEIAPSRGFSLHGTYWHNNFGTPMSHGCVNMKTEDAEKLFYWTLPSTGDKTTARSSADEPGTKVVIYGEAPKE